MAIPFGIGARKLVLRLHLYKKYIQDVYVLHVCMRECTRMLCVTEVAWGRPTEAMEEINHFHPFFQSPTHLSLNLLHWIHNISFTLGHKNIFTHHISSPFHFGLFKDIKTYLQY